MCELVRAHILAVLALPDRSDGTVLLKDLVASTQNELGAHAAFPHGRLRNYCTYVKVDLEARGIIERIPGSSPQRIRLVNTPSA
ncbi:hypothetical protein D6T64_13595 [Cryobacterium melibiosiphilum]|uniref:Uncharacterized protein n=1 Tax=Cryobacterium melibiosiphilum TaxID=995039 RepID=A0A3A5MLA8_9MICO|nr:hypothetical protein [Cryobacterium melibiosiphilum]RJT87633.1 hypothetical protein D6T64_13595 [Cryobacterium melibiosiphilum]